MHDIPQGTMICVESSTPSPVKHWQHGRLRFSCRLTHVSLIDRLRVVEDLARGDVRIRPPTVFSIVLGRFPAASAQLLD
jgi:hypothetical protein